MQLPFKTEADEKLAGVATKLFWEDIHKTNVLTKFHDDWTKNVTSRVFTSFFYNTNIRKKTPPPPGSHVFLPIRTIFELNRCIKETNVLTKFHKDWAKNKNAPPPGGHVFQMFTTIFKLIRDIHITNAKNVTSRRPPPPPPGGYVFLLIRTIFELDRRIQETNVLTKFHVDWTKNVTSRVFTCFYYIHIEKTALPPGGPINKTNLLTKFHDDWAKIPYREYCPAPWRPCFSTDWNNFELNQHIIKTNILTKLHEDWASNVTSTVFTSFELSRGFIGTNVLTKFHEDRTRNVASRVFTRQNVDDGRTTDKRRSQKLTMSTTGELTRNVSTQKDCPQL
ncbi:hypothetical protein DPMN_127497 [Dreissena polymorpha]|uniref:Uncharacterized protein n=1 Tax=Dreissena polymorpha TaxID=45954 RepID=A0A9D4GXR0_DREPO|nr:hypothetical protein DPMN_127497 [Dreissena polymorpha]